MNSKYLFEISWEVCNKVGGIHTVVTSKLEYCLKEFKDNYYSVGPYLPNTSNQTFKEEEIPSEFVNVASQLNEMGIVLHFGKWLVDHAPKTILIDWSGFTSQLGDLKSRYWEKYQLDTLGSDFYDVDQPLLWSTAIGIMIEKFALENPDSKMIVQVHEWMSAGSVLHLKQTSTPNARCIFTTHATVMGRALTSRGIYHEDQSSIGDVDDEARKIGVVAKHQIERIAGQNADAFTAVSKVTSDEAFRLLGVRPLVVENGLDLKLFPNFLDLSTAHKISRENWKKYIVSYFAPYYPIDPNKISLQFSMGRYEFHNKGYDLYLESLARLNQKMIDNKSDKTVVALFMVPGDSLHPDMELLNQMATVGQIQRIINEEVKKGIGKEIQDLMYNDAENQTGSGHKISVNISEENNSYLEQLISHLSHSNNPPLTPFELRNPSQDEILNCAKSFGLNNSKEDKVKVIFLPVYLDGFDGIFNQPLYDLVAGCDLGVFPSAYEPWGYTPMESLVMGVPCITSTLSGFGQAAEKMSQNKPEGILLLKREINNQDTAVEDLLKMIELSVNEDERSWVNRKISAYTSIQNFSWSEIYPKYSSLYNAD